MRSVHTTNYYEDGIRLITIRCVRPTWDLDEAAPVQLRPEMDSMNRWDGVKAVKRRCPRVWLLRAQDGKFGRGPRMS